MIARRCQFALVVAAAACCAALCHSTVLHGAAPSQAAGAGRVASKTAVEAPGYDWSVVDAAVAKSVADAITPGLVAAVADKTGTLYWKAFGHFTYGQPTPVNGNSPAVQPDSMFDLASLTKVTATTSAVAQFYQRGELELDMPLADSYLLGPRYAVNGKETITSRNCLLHNAGYPPDPSPGYSDPAFGCPATSSYHPAETFSCSEQIFASLLAQTLENPVGSIYVYSDLSMITMMYVVGTLAKNLNYVTPSMLLPGCANAGEGLTKTCYYEAYVRHYVFEPLKMTSTGFLPAQSMWANIMPTWNDTYYRHRTIQGQVSDENSYALGGIAGHAGIFTHAGDMLKLLTRIMFATPDDTFLNATTVKLFTTVYNLTQSSRALGWDTNSYTMNTYRGCANMSQVTYTHLGYTGTEVCNDPTRQLMTVFLTNRCYPNKTGNMDTIRVARQSFNNAVVKVYDAHAAAMVSEQTRDKTVPDHK